jgi:DNA (cytosine-5)-methyltransferase 1
MQANFRTTVEFFAGIGGFRLAADSVGLKTLWANDIDPRACLVYRTRFGKTIHEGDVNGFLDLVPRHDVLTGGFPCQPFSSAGKKLGTRDPRGTLFQVLATAIERHRPRFFVLENVKRLLFMEKGWHFATILRALTSLGYQVEWRLLNAMHFGLAQNRQRIIIVGSREPHQKRSLLAPAADFMELANEQMDQIHDQARWWEMEHHGQHFSTWGLAINDRFVSVEMPEFSEARPLITLEQILEKNVPQQFDFTATMQARLNDNSVVNRFVDGVEILSNQGGGARMGYTVFGIKGVAPTLTAATSRHYERYKIGDTYRRLTNVEYARLQGFPDGHCSAVSVYDQYTLFGNAVPPPMVKWVLNRLASGAVKIPEAKLSQLTLV